MIKVFYTSIISFGILSGVLSDFGKKIVRCVETVIKCTEGKTSKNTFEKLVFRFSWTFTRKTCSFTGKFLAGLSKLLSTCPEEPLKSNLFEKKSWKLQDFRIIFEVFGTMVEKLFQGCQNTNRSPREQFMKTFFSKEKHSLFFPILSNFFPSSEKFRQICETRNLGIRGSFLGKNIFEIYIFFHTSLKFDPKNAWSVNFFPVCLNCNPSVQRHFLRKSNFLLKEVVFAQLFWSSSNFVCFLTEKVRVSRKQPTNTEKNGGKKL